MSVKIILLALETLLLFLFLVPLPVICSGNLLGIIVSVTVSYTHLTLPTT